MTRRSPILVLILPLITLGIYAIVWYVVTKREMNRLGAGVPTAWLIIIPLINIYWMWKFSEGVGHVTKERMNGPVAFLLLFFLSFIGMAVVQSSLNSVRRKVRRKRPRE
jgi:hypothetical protein